MPPSLPPDLAFPLTTANLDQVLPKGHAGPTESALGVYLAANGGFLALLAGATLLWARWRRRARQAQARFQPDQRPAPGRTVLKGRVQYEQGADGAVSVEVEQVGSESESSGVWSHRWKEKSRRMKVRPFLLVVGDQETGEERVRVEPGPQVLLLDHMDRTVRLNLASRVRIAELTPGERVFVHGVVSPGTGGGVRWVLRPAQGPMEISTLPLGERALRRAAQHRSFARFYLACLLLLNLWIAGTGYYTAQWFGEQGWAVITGTHMEEHQDDEGSHIHREVALRMVEPAPVSEITWTEEVDEDLFGLLQADTLVPARASSFFGSAQLGQRATAPIFPILTALAVQALVTLLYARSWSAPVGWFEGPLDEGGSGTLKESKP